jgi:alpha-1,2-mannosyltransferase
MPIWNQTGPRDRRPGLSPFTIVAAALLVLVLSCIFLISPNFRARIPGGDYLQFYLAARVVRDGLSDQLYDFALQDRLQHDPTAMPFPPEPEMVGLYIYPPFFVWFCLPFSFLSFKAGATAWVLVMTACLVASVKVLVGDSKDNRHAFGLALLASLVFTPTLLALVSCQNATLSLLILSATYALLRAGREVAAGLVFALLAFKPQLTPVVACALLSKGRWRFVRGALLGGLALVMASLAISPSATAAYLRQGPVLSRWIDMPGMPLEGMSCWLGFWRLLLAGRPLREAQIAALVASLLTLIPLAWALRGRLEPTSERFPLQFAALILATILISPHLLAYDLTLLLLPMLLVALSHASRTHGGARDRLWPHPTTVVYAVATISRPVAAVTGLQRVVPLLFAYLITIASEVRSRIAIGVEACGKSEK